MAKGDTEILIDSDQADGLHVQVGIETEQGPAFVDVVLTPERACDVASLLVDGAEAWIQKYGGGSG